MADHKVTILPGYVLDPPVIGGQTDPIYKGDTVTFTNHEGDPCMLHFDAPSPFGKPEIGPIPNNSSASPEVKADVKNRQSFSYTCEPATTGSKQNTASTLVAASGSSAGSTARAASSTTSVATPPDQGIIIVDPPGGGAAEN